MKLDLPQEDSSPWMPLNNGHLFTNSPYGMPHLQHCSFGQTFRTLRCSAPALRECTQPSSILTLPSTYDRKKEYYSVTLWPHWMMALNKHLHQKILDMKVAVKVWMFPLHYVENHNHITFPARKFIFQTCHPKSMLIFQLPPCRASLIDLWRRWYNRKPLIWRWHTGSSLTQYFRRGIWWHGRRLPNYISWNQFLDGRTCSREVPVHT